MTSEGGRIIRKNMDTSGVLFGVAAAINRTGWEPSAQPPSGRANAEYSQ